jgi:hypothetical protein
MRRNISGLICIFSKALTVHTLWLEYKSSI